ncbi:MAG: hypothetical protein P4M09_06705 [Devosia sp.]|nr:hypothetical protein [Devosia sp.]
MLRRTARRDRLVGLFIAGVVLLDPPILNLMGGTVFGWPTLYVYLFAAWGLLIAGVALVMQRGAGAPEDRDADGRRR